jgi:hypothetical protein
MNDRQQNEGERGDSSVLFGYCISFVRLCTDIHPCTSLWALQLRERPAGRIFATIKPHLNETFPYYSFKTTLTLTFLLLITMEYTKGLLDSEWSQDLRCPGAF